MRTWLSIGSVAMLAGAGCAMNPTASDPDASRATSPDGAPNPDAALDAAQVAVDAAVDAPPPPPIQTLVGVDRASAITTAEAQSLATNHAVKWTGVYIGGACSAGSGWTPTQVAALSTAVGWTFMPIWVGQQSPSICGATALTAAQGKLDGVAAAARMADYSWKPNRKIPITLDLEAGSYTYSPSGSVAYVTAWRDAVRAAGYLAYVYSNPTAINGLFTADVKLDGAWPASWFYTGFHAGIAPDDLDQLGTHYTDHNRAWQYSGAFSVTGAGGAVDADVSDLLLAPAPDGTNL